MNKNGFGKMRKRYWITSFLIAGILSWLFLNRAPDSDPMLTGGDLLPDVAASPVDGLPPGLGAASDPLVSDTLGDVVDEGRVWANRFAHSLGPRASDQNLYPDLFRGGASAARSIAAVLIDLDPLRELTDGDLDAGLAPDAVNARGLAQSLAESAFLHRSSPEEVRREVLQGLEAVVITPVGAMPSRDGLKLAWYEKGRALAFLIDRDAERARAAYARIAEPLTQEQVRREAVANLIGRGLSRRAARSLFKATIAG